MCDYIIGIDPGESGAAVMLAVDSSHWELIKSHPSPSQFLEWTQKAKGDIIEVWIEELSGRPGDTPNTAFVLGTSYGLWQFAGRCIDPELKYIKPQVWQTRFVRAWTKGKERYAPNIYGERKTFIWELVKQTLPSCPKYAADAAAIGLLAVHNYKLTGAE